GVCREGHGACATPGRTPRARGDLTPPRRTPSASAAEERHPLAGAPASPPAPTPAPAPSGPSRPPRLPSHPPPPSHLIRRPPGPHMPRRRAVRGRATMARAWLKRWCDAVFGSPKGRRPVGKRPAPVLRSWGLENLEDRSVPTVVVQLNGGVLQVSLS